MDLSLIFIIDGSIIIIIGLLFCFFGYKLARPLFPLCGLLVLEGLIYIYIYGLFKMDTLGTWLFFGGTSIVIYVILFFLHRIAGFFTGLLGSALMLIFLINAFQLQNMDYVYPVCLTISVVSGLLTVVYEKVPVILFTSLFGACAAALMGLFIYINGVDAASLIINGNVFIPFERFIAANAYIITGIAAGVAALGILVQSIESKRVLPDNPRRRVGFKREGKHREISGDTK